MGKKISAKIGLSLALALPLSTTACSLTNCHPFPNVRKTTFQIYQHSPKQIEIKAKDEDGIKSVSMSKGNKIFGLEKRLSRDEFETCEINNLEDGRYRIILTDRKGNEYTCPLNICEGKLTEGAQEIIVGYNERPPVVSRVFYDGDPTCRRSGLHCMHCGGKNKIN